MKKLTTILMLTMALVQLSVAYTHGNPRCHEPTVESAIGDDLVTRWIFQVRRNGCVAKTFRADQLSQVGFETQHECHLHCVLDMWDWYDATNERAG
ncbi:hypothetical protein HDE_07645 [Halotydeus destructor]|nr:hypothetical protein HDE_07645 [Halotydeus destructor]